MNRIKSFVKPALLVAFGVAVGATATVWNQQTPTARAEIRQSPPRQAFKSGSERSETILREISSTLKTLDSRVERIERSVAGPAAPNPRQQR